MFGNKCCYPIESLCILIIKNFLSDHMNFADYLANKYAMKVIVRLSKKHIALMACQKMSALNMFVFHVS